MFAVERKTMNVGAGAGHGQWIFEEFMLSDSVFGYAEVRYRVQVHRLAECEGPGEHEMEILDPYVFRAVVFDDNGTPVEQTVESYKIVEAAVLEAFQNTLHNVIEYERGL
jgi:hypothetical protein